MRQHISLPQQQHLDQHIHHHQSVHDNHLNIKADQIIKIAIAVILVLLGASLFCRVGSGYEAGLKAIRDNQEINASIKKEIFQIKAKIDQTEVENRVLSEKVDELERQVRKLALRQNGDQLSKLEKELKEKDEKMASSSNSIPEKEKAQEYAITQLAYNQVRQTYFEQKMAMLADLSERWVNRLWFLIHPQAEVAYKQLSLNFRSHYTNVYLQNEARKLVEKERERLNRLYPFQKEELPFCMVVPTLNNAKNFRYEYNLQSIYNLQYDPAKLKVVITDDASTDGTADLIQQFLDSRPPKFNITLIRNSERRTPMPNHHRAITEYCGEDDIIVFLDGDDELISPWSLKVFNSVYQRTGAEVVYSDDIQLMHHSRQVRKGWSRHYSQEVIRNNLYRENGQAIAHLRSFKARLYRAIRVEDFKDEKGEWFTSNCDDAIFNPVLELSCGRIEYLHEEYFYLYNFELGSNDWDTLKDKMLSTIDYIRFHKPKYHCQQSLS